MLLIVDLRFRSMYQTDKRIKHSLVNAFVNREMGWEKEMFAYFSDS